ncbi:hypothetical protein JP09_002455 [Dehalogenimonas etheniformans]|uniref:Uncharacterized protein n=2 Tax=Dehalogenimonas etheniformans TaxID=1536648 RepID=A0A2P5P8X9_9CHLR|nr:hypothetical protein JP09_002455 [Dehalogenimonas etheniformans]
MTNSRLPNFPEHKLHIFNDVSFEVLPEISYENLVHLSHLVDQMGRAELYFPLVDCLRKIQWAKLAGIESIRIEKSIAERATQDTVPFDPIGQIQHMKALFDFVAHAKASLDALAVFLNDLLRLGQKGPSRDFKWLSFRQNVGEHDLTIGKHLSELEIWLDKDRDNSDSIIATRDEWQHRGSPSIQAMFPILPIGYLPVPRILKGGFPDPKIPLTSEYYWTTQEFIEYHVHKLTSFFSTVVGSCITIEKQLGGKMMQLDPDLLRHPMSFLPMRATAETKVKQIKVRPFNPIFLNSNCLFEGLPHKILQAITKEEAELFTNLAKNRTFRFPDKQKYFITLLEQDVLKIDSEQIGALENIGLIARYALKLANNDVLICGCRGIMVGWPSGDFKDISVHLLTKLGAELASLINISYDEFYIRNFIKILNNQKIDAKLLAISDINETSFKYDSLGEFRY